MFDLKQSTSIDWLIFCHDAAGDPVLALTDGSFTKRISKNGAAFAAMTVTITERELGFYVITISTSHSDTLGVLTIIFTNAGAKQVNLQFRVAARITDDLAHPTVSGRSTDVAATGEVGMDLGNVVGVLGNANVGWIDASGRVGLDLANVAGVLGNANVGWVDGSNRVDVGQWLGTAVTVSSTTAKPEMDAFSISDDTIPADKLEDMLDGTGAVDLWLSRVSIIHTAVEPYAVEISSQNGRAINIHADATGGFEAIRINSDLNHAVQLQADTAGMYGLFFENASNNGGGIGFNVASGQAEFDGNVDGIEGAPPFPVVGVADSGTTTTMVDAQRTEGDTDFWKGSWILFTDGNIKGQCRLVTAFNFTTNTMTFAPALTQAVASGRTYQMVPGADIESVTGAVGSVTGSVGSVAGNVDGSVSGNVDGSVASVTGAVGSVTGSVGSVAGNVDGTVAVVTTNTDMRGTDLAALATVCTATRLAELDPANLPTDIANLNDISTTDLDTALSDINLDHLLAVAATGPDVVNDSVIALMTAKGSPAVFTTFVNTTDSLEAVRDNQGGAAPTVAQIADGVWDEDIVAAHATADTGGLLLSQLMRRAITFNTDVIDGSALGQIADDGTAPYDRTTDSLQAQTDGGGTPPTAIAIADAILVRDVSNVEDSAPVDCLAHVILASRHFDRDSIGWQTNKTDGSPFGAIIPITELVTLKPIQKMGT